MAGLFGSYKPNMALLQAAQALSEASQSGRSTMQGITSGLLGYQGSKIAQTKALEEKKKQDEMELFNRQYKLDQQKYIQAQTQNLTNPQPKTVALSDMEKRYNRSVKQGFEGTFLEYQVALKEAGRPNIEINNAPKLPTGFQWIDPNNKSLGVMPIPGGKDDNQVLNKKAFDEVNLSSKNMLDAIGVYENTLEQYGTKILPGSDTQILNNAYKDVILQAKNLFELGVLAGEDLTLLEEYLTNPTSVMGNITEVLGGREGFTAQLNALKKKIKGSVDNARKTYNQSGGSVNKGNGKKTVKYGDLTL